IPAREEPGEEEAGDESHAGAALGVAQDEDADRGSGAGEQPEAYGRLEKVRERERRVGGRRPREAADADCERGRGAQRLLQRAKRQDGERGADPREQGTATVDAFSKSEERVW